MKKIIVFLSVLTVVIIVFVIGCRHNPVISPEVKTGPPIDTTHQTIGHPCSKDTVYFVNDILPLMVSNCAMSGCHDANADEVRLNNYNNIIQTGRVKPFSPGKSKIYTSVSGADDIMPPAPHSPLTAAQINLIYKWIQQGALDNQCDNGCDTTNVTFSGTISPIVYTYCKGCHSGPSPSGNIDLSGVTSVQTVALNGKLYGAIHGLNGFVKMPTSGSLTPCQIKAIDIWINGGAPNN